MNLSFAMSTLSMCSEMAFTTGLAELRVSGDWSAPLLLRSKEVSIYSLLCLQEGCFPFDCAVEHYFYPRHPKRSSKFPADHETVFGVIGDVTSNIKLIRTNTFYNNRKAV